VSEVILSPDCSSRPSGRSTPPVTRAAHLLFDAFLILALSVPSLTSGPLNWLPILRFNGLAEGDLGVGPLVLLPVAALGAWILSRLTDGDPRPWRWGITKVTLPLAGLTVATCLGLEPRPTRRTIVVLLMLLITWWVYLFVLNEEPGLAVPASAVLLVQGCVALGQFVLQGDLGLQWMGEPALDPQLSGTSVLFARGHRWLRPYGLTGHPNLLGATLAALLLLLVAETDAGRRGSRVWFTAAASAGVLGLLVTFSRGSWLAFSVGLTSWGVWRILSDANPLTLPQLGSRRAVGRMFSDHLHIILPAALAVLFLVSTHDLVLSRFLHLDTAIEAPSIEHRETDARLAIHLIRRHPWTGVGTQNYLPAVRAVEPDSRTVHNVFLLTGAELGLPGAVLWLWLTAAVLARPSSRTWAAWVALTVAGLFDVAVHPTNNWFASVLLGLTAAGAAAPRARAPNTQMESEGRRMESA